MSHKKTDLKGALSPRATILTYDQLVDVIALKRGFTNGQREMLRLLGGGCYAGYANAQVGEYSITTVPCFVKVDETKKPLFQKMFEDNYIQWWLLNKKYFDVGPKRPRGLHFAYMTKKTIKEFGDALYDLFSRGRYGGYIKTKRTAFKIWMGRSTHEVEFASCAYPTDMRNHLVTIKTAKLSPEKYKKLQRIWAAHFGDSAGG